MVAVDAVSAEVAKVLLQYLHRNDAAPANEACSAKEAWQRVSQVGCGQVFCWVSQVGGCTLV